MWLLVVLGVVVMGLNRSTQQLQARSAGAVAQVQARWVARAGVEQGLERLAADLTPYDWAGDPWYDDPAAFDQVVLADGFGFWVTAPGDDETPDNASRYGLDDEASRMSVNAYGAAALSSLEHIPDEQTALAIIDWRDGNERQPPGGAERSYYLDQEIPYDIRNAPFRTHRELLLVKGVDAATFFGEDVDRDGRLDPAEDDGPRLPPDDDADGTLDRGLAGSTSVYAYRLNRTMTNARPLQYDQVNEGELQFRFNFSSALAEEAADRLRGQDDPWSLVGLTGDGEALDGEIDEIDFAWVADNYEAFTDSDEDVLGGRVNINTARRAVLEAIPQLPADAVDDLLDLREQGSGFTRLGGLFERGVLNEGEFRRAAPRLTVRSNTFRVLSRGVAPGGGDVTVEAVLDRGGTRPVILYWHER
jgi:general secretion pathway protein K